MTGENRRQRAAKDNPIPELDFSPPPLVPPVNVVRPSADATDLDRWATERISIYASLDAAMTQHIVEAISALSELKERAEEEARQASQQIIAERDKVTQTVQELRQERAYLETSMDEVRRSLDEEKTRLDILQRSSEAWIGQSQVERDELQIELRRLRAMVEETNRDLKELYQRRSALLEENGGFAGWLERQKAAASDATTPVVPNQAKPAYPAYEPKIPGPQQDFGDSPTPRIPGGSPVVWLSPEKRANLAANRRMTDEKLAALLMETDPETPNALRAIDLFEEISNQDAAEAQALEPASFAVDPSTTDNNPELAAIFKTGNTSRAQNRRSRTEQRINQILNRTRTTPDNSEEGSAEQPVASLAPALEKKNSLEPTTAEFLHLLGVQLGLDPATPPSTSGFSFAPGYTPPPAHKPLRELLGDVTENAQAINNVEQPPVMPVMPFEETSPEADDLDITSLLRGEDDFGDKTLAELVADAEEEAASLNENPTPPDEPSPFIGELGDNAARFETRSATPKFPFSPDDSLRPVSLPAESTTPPPPFPVPIATRQTRKPTGGLLYPGFPIKPPALGTPPRADMSGTVQTRVTISNLQGRYSPLMMEKVVRGLPDVLHVIVTDFSKGVLVMDVRHEAHLDVREKLLSMPELRLRLVAEADGLEFMQEDSQENSRGLQA